MVLVLVWGSRVMCTITSEISRSFSRVPRERTFEPVQLIDMLITEDCNCRCDYCFVHGKRPKRMSEEIVKATVDFLLLKSRHLRRVELLFFRSELGSDRVNPPAESM